MLLEYFGQNSQRCGLCDICLSRNELDMSKYEFDIILDEIKSSLSENDLDLDSLLLKIEGEEAKVLKVVRWLLDHDKILQDSNNMLVWNH